jgi:hypothetical protein
MKRRRKKTRNQPVRTPSMRGKSIVPSPQRTDVQPAALTLVVDSSGHAFLAAPGYSAADVARVLRIVADDQRYTSPPPHPAPAPLETFPSDASYEEILTALREMQLMPTPPASGLPAPQRARLQHLCAWLDAALHRRRHDC